MIIMMLDACCCFLVGRGEDSPATRGKCELKRQGRHYRADGGVHHGPQGRCQAPSQGNAQHGSDTGVKYLTDLITSYQYSLKL